MALTVKQRAFTLEYLKDFNATQAAIRAGYSTKTARSQGQRLLTNVDIKAEIALVLEEKVMSRDEVLKRLAEHARADIREFIEVLPGGRLVLINLEKATDTGNTHLIKKIKITKAGPELELHDSQAALVHLGRHYGLFTDKVEHSGEVETVVKVLKGVSVDDL